MAQGVCSPLGPDPRVEYPLWLATRALNFSEWNGPRIKQTVLELGRELALIGEELHLSWANFIEERIRRMAEKPFALFKVLCAIVRLLERLRWWHLEPRESALGYV